MLFLRNPCVRLLKGFRSGGSVVKAMEEVLERSEQSKDYNLFAHQDAKAMLANAAVAEKRYKEGIARPLEGIPLGVKDNVNTTDGPVTGGIGSLKGNIPKFNSTLMVRLFDAGVINAGKTNMHETAFGTTTNNAHYGPARCAMDYERSAGGSSGGSGVAVGNGTVPIALGTDTGGSIRIPAASNGCVGYKPTINRWPADYGLKMTHYRDTIGPIANCMEDVVLFDEIVSTQPHNAKVEPGNVKIGVLREYYHEDLAPEVADAAKKTVDKLKAAGFKIVEYDGIQGLRAANEAASLDVINFEAGLRLQEYLFANGISKTPEELLATLESPDVISIFKGIAENPVDKEKFYDMLFNRRIHLRTIIHNFFNSNELDCILYPTFPMLPPKFEDISKDDFTIMHNGKRVSQLLKSINNVDPGSNTNSPAITLPVMPPEVGVLPVGMEVMALTHEDRKLIAIARAVEKALPL